MEDSVCFGTPTPEERLKWLEVANEETFRMDSPTSCSPFKMQGQLTPSSVPVPLNDVFSPIAKLQQPYNYKSRLSARILIDLSSPEKPSISPPSTLEELPEVPFTQESALAPENNENKQDMPIDPIDLAAPQTPLSDPHTSVTDVIVQPEDLQAVNSQDEDAREELPEPPNPMEQDPPQHAEDLGNPHGANVNRSPVQASEVLPHAPVPTPSHSDLCEPLQGIAVTLSDAPGLGPFSPTPSQPGIDCTMEDACVLLPPVSLVQPFPPLQQLPPVEPRADETQQQRGALPRFKPTSTALPRKAALKKPSQLPKTDIKSSTDSATSRPVEVLRPVRPNAAGWVSAHPPKTASIPPPKKLPSPIKRPLVAPMMQRQISRPYSAPSPGTIQRTAERLFGAMQTERPPSTTEQCPPVITLAQLAEPEIEPPRVAPGTVRTPSPAKTRAKTAPVKATSAAAKEPSVPETRTRLRTPRAASTPSAPPAQLAAKKPKTPAKAANAKPGLPASKLLQITNQNTVRNRQSYNMLDILTIYKDEPRPPSPSASLRKISTARREALQERGALKQNCDALQAMAPQEDVPSGSSSGIHKRPHQFAPGDDECGFMSPTKRRCFDADAKFVRWDRVLFRADDADKPLHTPSRAAEKLGKPVMAKKEMPVLDAFGNVPNAKHTLSPILPRKKVQVTKIVYADDEEAR